MSIWLESALGFFGSIVGIWAAARFCTFLTRVTKKAALKGPGGGS